MNKPESTRVLRFIKRIIDFIDGPPDLPRCRAPFCGDILPESAVVTGRIYCETCEPAIYRVVKRNDDIYRIVKRTENTAPRPFGGATGKGVN